MSAERRSKYPEQLRRFVSAVEDRARSAGRTDARARIYGAWAACFVRYCTVRSLSWEDPDHVGPFLTYLRDRQQVEAASRRRAAEGLAFLFQDLLETDVRQAAWHPESPTSTSTANDASTSTSIGQEASRAGSGDAFASDESTSDDGASQGPASEDGTSHDATQGADAAPSGDERASAASPDTRREATNASRAEQSSLLTRLLFHTSLPIHEALDLRAGDVDLSAGLIYVSDSLGTPKRIVELPEALREPLRKHVERVRREAGLQSFDAALFQANTLQGRVQSDAEETSAEPSTSEASEGQADDAEIPNETRGDGDARSLWSYTSSE